MRIVFQYTRHGVELLEIHPDFLSNGIGISEELGSHSAGNDDGVLLRKGPVVIPSLQREVEDVKIGGIDVISLLFKSLVVDLHRNACLKKPGARFHCRKFGLQAIQQGHPGIVGGLHAVGRDPFFVHQIGTVGIFVVLVVGQFIARKEHDDDGRGNAQRQAGDIDQGVAFPLHQVTDGYFQVGF